MTTTTHEIHTTDCGCLVVAQEWRHGIDGVSVETVDVDLGVIYFANKVTVNAYAERHPHTGYHMTREAAIALASSLLKAALELGPVGHMGYNPPPGFDPEFDATR